MRNLDTAEAKSGGFAAAAWLRCHQAAAAKHGKVKGFLCPWATLDTALTRSAQLFGPYTWKVLCHGYPESSGGDKTTPRAG